MLIGCNHLMLNIILIKKCCGTRHTYSHDIAIMLVKAGIISVLRFVFIANEWKNV